jgi:signal transduction histidine kinase
LQTIADLGRQAVGDLRRIVGVLREPGSPPGVQTPGGAELAALAAAMNDAGMPSKLTIIGEAAPLEPALAMAVYRIVQESLTNALKHSDRTQATVTVEHSAAGVAVHIRSRGTSTEATGGYGLAGMRERAALVGGRLSAGPRDGHWEVSAVLPR